ncbi:MAG: BAX inhibitor (BI)-1/YccA family protein, partial [Candidatus Kapabacteria bacterium]|nr:BAX inhibitor (BI)-1/YccA family protein [Candidatus Kapabacteria bacterium]
MPTSSQYIDTSLQRAWVQRVYAWMMGGLLCTAATSALVYSIEPLFVAIFGNMLLRWVFMLLPLGMVIFL